MTGEEYMSLMSSGTWAPIILQARIEQAIRALFNASTKSKRNSPCRAVRLRFPCLRNGRHRTFRNGQRRIFPT